MNEDTLPEQWRAVVGWSGFYEVSDQGRVRGVDRIVVTAKGRRCKRRGQIMRPQGYAGNYKHATMSDGHVQVHVPIQWLVLEAFVGPRPQGYEACHGDGDRTNNRLSNLRWDTIEANKRDMVRHGRHVQAQKQSCPRGHPLVEPNLTANVKRRGHRGCLACSRAHGSAAHWRRQGFTVNFQALSDEKYAAIMAISRAA